MFAMGGRGKRGYEFQNFAKTNNGPNVAGRGTENANGAIAGNTKFGFFLKNPETAIHGADQFSPFSLRHWR
jgi:hypothetical protein